MFPNGGGNGWGGGVLAIKNTVAQASSICKYNACTDSARDHIHKNQKGRNTVCKNESKKGRLCPALPPPFHFFIFVQLECLPKDVKLPRLARKREPLPNRLKRLDRKLQNAIDSLPLTSPPSLTRTGDHPERQGHQNPLQEQEITPPKRCACCRHYHHRSHRHLPLQPPCSPPRP